MNKVIRTIVFVVRGVVKEFVWFWKVVIGVSYCVFLGCVDEVKGLLGWVLGRDKK